MLHRLHRDLGDPGYDDWPDPYSQGEPLFTYCSNIQVNGSLEI